MMGHFPLLEDYAARGKNEMGQLMITYPKQCQVRHYVQFEELEEKWENFKEVLDKINKKQTHFAAMISPM